jgi:hypothetical protein
MTNLPQKAPQGGRTSVGSAQPGGKRGIKVLLPQKRGAEPTTGIRKWCASPGMDARRRCFLGKGKDGQGQGCRKIGRQQAYCPRSMQAAVLESSDGSEMNAC